MADYDDVNTPLIAYVGGLSVIITAAIIMLLQVVYYRAEAQQQAIEEQTPPPAELTEIITQQQAKLSGYRVINQDKKIVAVPIDRAMDLVVAELAPSTVPKPAAHQDAKETTK